MSVFIVVFIAVFFELAIFSFPLIFGGYRCFIVVGASGVIFSYKNSN